ncbi:MAG: deoxyribodipyrimidine photo-lyase [Bacteroidota bacterium]
MPINVVWLKRDIRWHDHAAIYHASKEKLPLLFVYLFEPTLLAEPEISTRQCQFAYQGLQGFCTQLPDQKSLLILHCEAMAAFEKLNQHYSIHTIFSHQETGLEITYRRDQAMRKWCKQKQIKCREFERDGVQRNIKNRIGWQQHWDDYMQADQYNVNPSQLKYFPVDQLLFRQEIDSLPEAIRSERTDYMKGGECEAIELLSSFTCYRAKDYLRNLARPALSRETCSRLSPYIANGNISVRRVYQETEKVKGEFGQSISQFHNRLWWRCHYIQKLETEYQIQDQHINTGFDTLQKEFRQDYFDAWSTGKTGFPMIDASMRCLNQTGYLNFRMRAMLATFWSFTLWQDWRIGATYLAKIFLDFEPGIHYPQFQMQAGMTGYHPLRIFNPIVQAKKYDDYGAFIKKWVPELASIPEQLIAEPWKLSPMECSFYNVQLGEGYPHPIVDYDLSTKAAKDRYWAFRNSDLVRSKLPALWEKHSLPQDIAQYEKDLNICPSIVTESVMYNPTEK